MAPRRRALTETDQAEWASYARRIAPLRGAVQLVAAEPDIVAPSPPRPAEPVRRPPPIRHAPPVAIGGQPGGIDTSTWQRFQGGKLQAVRRLDLHGQTAQRAFYALKAFIRTAHADHVRCVEVITGRGSGEQGGVIKREFPIWLNLPDIRPMILAASHPHAANPGSVRLLLRRIR